ncbi:MAG: hypothetical protein ACTSYC_04840 [Promethearchaeota archaeon]
MDPITTMGKLVSSVISVMGITLFLLPASVIGSGFMDEIQARNPLLEKCRIANMSSKETNY